MKGMEKSMGNNIEEENLKKWRRAQETASLGIDIRDVKIKGGSVEIEAWVRSSREKGKEYGVMLPLKKKESSDKYGIMMNDAIHECDDIKFNYADVCRHIRAVAIYVKEHFKEIKKEHKLKGINLA